MKTSAASKDGRWTIIFDGDGTLWQCDYYPPASANCIARIREAWPDCPISDAEIDRHEHRVQRALLKRYGFYLTIFEAGWVETYIQLCHTFQRPVEQRMIADIRRLAGAIHLADYPVFAGVIPTLDDLLAAGYELHLLTLGDKTFQWSKIRRNGLAEHFSQVHVVQQGKERSMRMLACNGRPTIMVGDSYWSDIVPAKVNSLTPVWIHTTESWHLGDGELDLGGVHVIRSVPDVPKLLDHLNSNPFRPAAD